MPRVNESLFTVPDTKRNYETDLPFGRAGVWNLARAVAQARAVYPRFLLMLSDEVGEAHCDYKILMQRPQVMQQLRESSILATLLPICFFYIDSKAQFIFICDKTTIRHVWQSDTDVHSHAGRNSFTTVIASTKEYGIFLDAYPWDFGDHGNGFATRSESMQVVQALERRSELHNTHEDWKFFRRWRNGQKAKMWEDRYPWDETKRIRDTELYKPVNITSSPGCNRDASNAMANDNVQAGKWSLIPKRPLTIVPANAKFNKTET